MVTQITNCKTALIATFFFFGIINTVASRSIGNPGNFTIDRFDVPARYVYEIYEDESEKDIKKIQGYRDSGLAFDMPIAVAVLCAVMLLICCFCCLRCAVGYDSIKRNGFYYGSKKSGVVDIARKLKTEMPIKQ